MIIEIFPSGPLGTNAFLVGCELTKKGIFIDPSQGSASKLIAAAKRHGLEVKSVYLTHSHWDHLADLAILKKNYELDVYVHPLDAGNVRDPGSDGIPLMGVLQGVEPNHLLNEGDQHHVGNLEFTVIHTPGHSPGAVCFFFEKEKVLISGDTLFKGTIGTLSLPTSEEEKMWSSLKKLAALPHSTKVYPGHGATTTLGEESWIINAKEIFGNEV